jgi:hypothetical protein
MARRDWSKPVSSLLNKLQKAGFSLYLVNDGEEDVILGQGTNLAVRKEATEIITSVDYSILLMKKENVRYYVNIFLDNDPDEIVTNHTDNDDLNDVIDAYSDQWQGKKCPVVAD